MTIFFNFAGLTWPEVAALSRDTPLLIPLGDGFPLEIAAEALSHPKKIGRLPALPYGWRGSGLVVPVSSFRQMVLNLVNSLRDDGFSRVYVVTPPDLGPELGSDFLALPHPSRINPPISLPPDSDQGKVVLIPIGHTEQHGHHLPLATDTVIIDAIGQGTAQATPDLTTVLPVFPYGVSTHRPSFAGTLNCGGRAFEDFWLDVIDLLVSRGFDRFYLISGHGGNCSFLVNVVKYAGERHRRIFCATTWLHTSGYIARPVLEATRHSARGGMGHAGELETAMMLYLQPAQVKMDRVVDEVDFISTESYTMDWVEAGDMVANPPWDDDSQTGAYGAGSLATVENGKLWLETAVKEKIAHVEEIHEQHKRREARRQAGYGLWGKP